MSNSWKASLQQATQSGMMTVLGLLKSARPQQFITGDDEPELELSFDPDHSWIG